MMTITIFNQSGGGKMSMEGIKRFADVMSVIRQARIDLVGMGDNQDIRLGQLLLTAHDSVKDDFAKITIEK
jgi:hypothetical protein